MITIKIQSPKEFSDECKHRESCIRFGVEIPKQCLDSCNVYSIYLWGIIRDQLNSGGVSCLEEKDVGSTVNAIQKPNVDCLECGLAKVEHALRRKSEASKSKDYQDIKEDN